MIIDFAGDKQTLIDSVKIVGFKGRALVGIAALEFILNITILFVIKYVETLVLRKIFKKVRNSGDMMYSI